VASARHGRRRPTTPRVSRFGDFESIGVSDHLIGLATSGVAAYAIDPDFGWRLLAASLATVRA
jgi:hypothetical protein